jgi:hypothetical protein
MQGRLRDGENSSVFGSRLDMQAEGRLHHVKDGFAHGPEEYPDADAATEGESEPLPKRELGLGVFPAEADVSDG